jgi:phosphoribosylformimino-5-aminoimidazole carboxamide ribotide isomerase
MNSETIFSDHPEEMALHWEHEGAERLHIVDLDGAVRGRACNRETIKRVVDIVSIPVQVGGGIRSLDAIEEYFGLGVDKIIIGTGAYKNPELVTHACAKYPGRIIVGIDSRDNYVAVEGWTESTMVTSSDLAHRFEDMGIDAIIFTDIKRDGMKRGPNIEGIREFARCVKVPVIAAGGISSVDDIQALASLEEDGVKGVIVGRALYDRQFSLGEAIRAGKKGGRYDRI